MQADLFDRPATTRAAARQRAMDDARARGEDMAERAGAAADRAVERWCANAAEKLRTFARAQGGVWTVEMARSVLDSELPRPPDLRAWGKVTTMAKAAGYIEQVPRMFFPAASSNGAMKAVYRKGPKA